MFLNQSAIVGSAAAEQRYGERVGQAHAQCTDLDRKQLRLHYRADRTVQRRDRERDHHQDEARSRHRAPFAERDSNGTVVSSASTPNVMSIGRRPTRSDRAPISGCSSMKTNRLAAETSVDSPFDRPTVLDQEELHVGREHVEVQRAAHREAEHDEHFAPVLQQEVAS